MACNCVGMTSVQTDPLGVALEKRQLRLRLPSAPQRRLLRLRAMISQETIAQSVGVDRATVCRWETGEREPRDEHLADYINVLDRLAAEPLR